MDTNKRKKIVKEVNNKNQNDSVGPVEVTKNRVIHRQMYRKAWESLPEFKDWLESDGTNKLRGYCKICKKSLHAHRLTLLKHTASMKHMKRAYSLFEQKELAKKSNDDTKISEEEKNKTVVSNEVDRNITSMCISDNNKNNCLTNNITANINEDYDDENDIRPDGKLIIDLNNTFPLPGSSNDEIIVGTPPEPSSTYVTEKTPVYKPPISTHVLDTSIGLPVQGLPVCLYKLIEGRWTFLQESFTNPDGRCSNLIQRNDLLPGRFKLNFNINKYYEMRKVEHLFPFVELVFDIHSPTEHIHIPLLVSPFGYSTYKGS